VSTDNSESKEHTQVEYGVQRGVHGGGGGEERAIINGDDDDDDGVTTGGDRTIRTIEKWTNQS